MFRRPLSIGAAFVLAVAAATIAPMSASAATTCSVDATPDAKVVLDSNRPTFDVALNSSPKGCFDTVVYNVVFKGTPVGTVTFDGTDSDTFEADSSLLAGKYTVAFKSGTDTSGTAITASNASASGFTDARDAITVDLVAARTGTGNLVSLGAHVEEFSPKYGDYAPIRSAAVTIQAKTAYGWQTLATGKTDRRGNLNKVADSKSKKVLQWRAIVAATTSHWGGDSINNSSGE